MRQLTLAFQLLAALRAFAALPPTSAAPLKQHLLEVNSQWLLQDPSPAGGHALAVFSDEPARIREHLRRVSAALLSRDVEASGAQREKRVHLLRRLAEYADARAFPQNHVMAFRNPIFIDPHGTACAVGWLMIESGHEQLALRIRDGLNTGYVHEIIADPRFTASVAAWAGDHGFSAEELAWIQPGYPPSLPWQPFGGGANGTVTVMEELANGHMLIGGDFTDVGGTAANRVAIWNGTSFVALGSGLQGIVNCAVEFNGEIYVGGGSLSGLADLAKWNGTGWSFQTVFASKYSEVTALHVHNGQLHAAGIMTGIVGASHQVARWDGADWQPVGSGFNGHIHALDSRAGVLVAGGAFTGFFMDPNPNLNHVAEIEGNEWTQLGDGLNATVRDLLSIDGVLHAAGELYVNIAPAFGMARIAPGAAYWEQLMPGLSGYIYDIGLTDPRIQRIDEREGSIYFVGDFGISSSVMLYGYNIGRWDGIDQVAELGIPEAPVHALCVLNDQLIIGGAFSNWAPHLAVLDLTTSVGEASATLALSVFPNPVISQARISGLPDMTGAAVRIVDADGREAVVPLRRHDDAIVLDASALAPGVYHVRVDTKAGTRHARLVRP